MNSLYGNLGQPVPEDARKEKVKVMQKVMDLGFSVEAIKDTLERKKLNHVNACHKLLLLDL